MQVRTGDRVGLVGANGCGKTTMVRVLAGDVEPTAGTIVKSSPSLRVAFLKQEFTDELVTFLTPKPISPLLSFLLFLDANSFHIPTCFNGIATTHCSPIVLRHITPHPPSIPAGAHSLLARRVQVSVWRSLRHPKPTDGRRSDAGELGGQHGDQRHGGHGDSARRDGPSARRSKAPRCVLH